MKKTLQPVKDASHLYEVESRARHAERPGFPKEELRLGPGETYTVRPRRPHLVINGGDAAATFLVLQGIGEYDFVPMVAAS